MDITYVISIDEVLWGSLLLAFTMAVHGTGMVLTLRVNEVLSKRYSTTFVGGVALVIVMSWLILLTNLLEVMMWAGFFVFQGALPSHSVAFYNALLNYTTLQAGYLPARWHLLEGLLGMAGLMTMAWSTGTLFALVDGIQRKQVEMLKSMRLGRRRAGERA